VIDSSKKWQAGIQSYSPWLPSKLTQGMHEAVEWQNKEKTR